jgi:hypothetical protein
LYTSNLFEKNSGVSSHLCSQLDFDLTAQVSKLKLSQEPVQKGIELQKPAL